MRLKDTVLKITDHEKFLVEIMVRFEHLQEAQNCPANEGLQMEGLKTRRLDSAAAASNRVINPPEKRKNKNRVPKIEKDIEEDEISLNLVKDKPKLKPASTGLKKAAELEFQKLQNDYQTLQTAYDNLQKNARDFDEEYGITREKQLKELDEKTRELDKLTKAVDANKKHLSKLNTYAEEYADRDKQAGAVLQDNIN